MTKDGFPQAERRPSASRKAAFRGRYGQDRLYGNAVCGNKKA